MGLGICCSVESMKAKNLENISLLFGVFNLLLSHMSFEELVNIFLLIVRFFECLYRRYSGLGQKENPLTCKLCTDDSKPKA